MVGSRAVPVLAVLFDIGGVLEKVDPPERWLTPWARELGLTADEVAAAMQAAAPAELMHTGVLTEPEYTGLMSRALGLTADQRRHIGSAGSS